VAARRGLSVSALLAEELRVLVAEDFPVNQQVIRAVLEAFGCVVTVANDGREAVEAIQQAQFDLVFMDCQMPEMDGYMATRAIRALELEGGENMRRTPIVALTAHATQADRERCLDAGMDSYVSKPFTQAVLLRELQCWLPDRQAAPHTHPAAAPALAPALETQALDVRTLNELRLLERGAPGDMLQVFVNTYLVHTTALLARLRAAVETGDLASIEHEAHKLKSGSLTLGVRRVGKLGYALEQESRARSMTHCDRLLKEIDAEFVVAEKLLKAEVQAARAAA